MKPASISVSICAIAAVLCGCAPKKNGVIQHAGAAGPPPIGAIPREIVPLDDRPGDEGVTQQLEDIFAAVDSTTAAIQPGPDATAQQRAIEYELRIELESFAVTNAD